MTDTSQNGSNTDPREGPAATVGTGGADDDADDHGGLRPDGDSDDGVEDATDDHGDADDACAVAAGDDDVVACPPGATPSPDGHDDDSHDGADD